jgi:hypothetical protein
LRDEADGAIIVYMPAGGGTCLAAHRLGHANLPDGIKEPQRTKVLQAMAIGGTLTFTCRRHLGRPLGLGPEQWSDCFPDVEILHRRGPTEDGSMTPEVSKWFSGEHIESWDLGSDNLPSFSLTELERMFAKGHDLDEVVARLNRYKPRYEIPTDRFTWQF